MSRLTQLLLPIAFIGVLWVILLTGVFPVVSSSLWWNLVLPFPVYCGILLGFYALFSIAVGVYNVKDDFGAVAELRKDIERARKGLQEKGFRFDT